MRTGYLFTSLLSACALTCLLSSAAFAQGNLPKNPNTLAIPTGLNSTISLTHALLAIDDKSPMANSINNSVRWRLAIDAYFTSDRSFLKKFSDFKAALVNLLNVRPLLMTNTSLGRLSTLKVQDIPSGSSPLSDPNLFDRSDSNIKMFLETLDALPGATEFLNLKLVGRGIIIRNRWLISKYLAYLKLNILDAFEITPADKEWFSRQLPPDIISSGTYAGIQVRSGGGPTVYTPELILSSGSGGFDVAAQAYLSELNGYAASFRVDLSPGRTEMVHAVSLLRAAQAKLQAPLSDNKNPNLIALAAAIVDDNPKDSFFSTQADADRRIVQMQLAMRSSVQFSYRHVNSAGSFSIVGLSVSKLYPVTPGNADRATPASPYNGITFLFNAQALQYDPITGSGASTILNRVAVYWQDRVSRLLPGPPGKQIGDIRRWSVQSGVEYNFSNSLQPNDTYGAFLRERIGNFTEFTVSAGRGADKKGFLGFSFGKTFF